jgi:hypothetical protein
MIFSKQIIILLSLQITISCYSQNNSLPIIKNLGTCEYGIQNAEKDAKKGNYRLLSYGLPMQNDWGFYEFYQSFLFDKYEITIDIGGCVIYIETEWYTNYKTRFFTLETISL